MNLILLRDEILAEAKRRGHAVAGLGHAASVLARRQPEWAENLPDGALARVDDHLQSQPGRADLPTIGEDVESLFDETTKASDPEEFLRKGLAEYVANLPEAETPDEQEADATTTSRSSESSTPPPKAAPKSTASLQMVEPRELLGRAEIIDEVVAHLSHGGSRSPALVGPHGSGRTSLLAGLAERLSGEGVPEALAGRKVFRVDAHAVIRTGRADAMRRLLKKVDDRSVLAVDDLSVLADLHASRADIDMLSMLATVAHGGEPRTVFVLGADEWPMIQTHIPALAERLEIIEVPILGDDDLFSVVMTQAEAIGAELDVTIDRAVGKAALAPAADGGKTRAHPGLALDRLSGAAGRARAAGQDEVSIDDLHLPRDGAEPVAIDRDDLLAQLQDRVLGQDEALNRVTSRLVLTRGKMDLRPDRPDGVFLLIGPTGVGKTALGQAIADTVYGSKESLIRLDMSEYAHDWAVSSLTGPQPGYVGFTEPSGWLTTQVREQPQSVVLLDEIEKAHPTIWNVFLQVFDAGRLRDTWGELASFSDAIVVMTSNVGADEFGKGTLGFGNERTAGDRVLERLSESMPPELVNRIDEVVVFDPLSRESIRAIAEREIRALTERMRARGYELTIPEDVIESVATTGYDERYGARHLHRNLERLLLQPLAAKPQGTYLSEIAGDSVVWKQA